MSRMLLRKEGRGWRGIYSKKWRPVKVKAWDMREHGICLEYGGYCSVTSDKVLKIVMRNWRRENCQTCLLGFSLPIGQVVVPFTETGDIGKELSLTIQDC